ncbi:MAG: glycoside hydrolase family 65 protein [Anaerolineae bacterium]|nr:glycoside hydrolase family 65 protein [Anaerolineae bacterium]MCI0610258.1 glycoside hydrolase family 65 protein [Anaerolineae bacterium]
MTTMFDPWILSEDSFDPKKQHHKETVFTIGNGYLCTRGAFEEGYPGDHRATFIHGVFDEVPIDLTELANAPDWLPISIYLNGERFSLDSGTIESFQRILDLRTGLLTRIVRWRSPSGMSATLTFERFASLADEHLLCARCRVTPEFAGTVEFRAGLNGNMHNEGLVHWQWLGQGERDGVTYLHNCTRKSRIEIATAMQITNVIGREIVREAWDVENAPTRMVRLEAAPGQTVGIDKRVAVFTSRDVESKEVVNAVVNRVRESTEWESALEASNRAWTEEWNHTDVIIEGDNEVQISIRFNLFQMLVAAPRHDDRVNIGAKTLSGFGYRGHAFWDTEIFMLPLFNYTAPHIAKNLLNYRYRNLPGARRKAQANGFEGAQFPWKSADTGDEVTPTWVPHFADRTKLVRIWAGDIEIHISADIAHAVHQYWQATSDEEWFIEKGVELILDTAKFWASRAEWNADAHRYEYNDVIGPDEYHEHVNNNAYTNRMAQWNLQTALEALEWLKGRVPEKANELVQSLDLNEERLKKWRDVIEKIYLHIEPSGLIEQFEGYYQRKDIDLAALEPRAKSAQEIFGIEGCNETQILKQPDVLMMQYILRKHYSAESVRANYDYYNPRTDHTYGSSLGPSIQAIVACMMDYPEDAYEHFIRAVRADLRDVRGNASDGIHAASSGGTWQAVVFGFGGLQVTSDGWTTMPRLPKHWKRLAFKFFHRGKMHNVDLKA